MALKAKHYYYFEKLKKRAQAKEEYEAIKNELCEDRLNKKITEKEFQELIEVNYQECQRQLELYA